MEFTRDELARLVATLEILLIGMIETNNELPMPHDYLTPTMLLTSFLKDAYYDHDKILHIGIKD